MHISKKAGLLLSTFFFASQAAAGPDSGRIEYRVAEPVTVTEAMVKNSKGEPLALAPLVRMSSMPRDSFNSAATTDATKDVYSISLEHAVLGGFINEGRWAQPGEIVILANVFEFSDKEGAGGRFYEFPEIDSRASKDANSSADLKVIYFTPDAYLHQPLNFSALTITPPTRYHGRPIGIQIVILELDRVPGPLQSLLGTLADLASPATATAGLPGAEKIMFDLGKSLLDGKVNQDDVLFEFRMELMPYAPLMKNDQATFQPGRHVFIRQQDRSSPVPWGDLRLDHNTQKLLTNANHSALGCKQNVSCEFTRDSYLVVNVVKHSPTTQLAYYQHRTMAELNAALRAAENAGPLSPLNSVTANLQERLADVRSNAWGRSVQEEWSKAEGALAIFDDHRYPGSDPNVTFAQPGTCDIQDATELKTDLLKKRIGAKNALRDFLTRYREGLQAKTGGVPGDANNPPEPEFAPDERTALVQRLAIYAVPKDQALEQYFTGHAAFEARYIDSGAKGDFPADIIAALEAQERTLTCDEVRSRGWSE